MLLAIDIGNTNTVLGIYQSKDLMHHWRISTNSYKTSDEMGILLKQLFAHKGASLEDINHVIISSVVPTIMSALQIMCMEYFKVKPLIVKPDSKTGLGIKFDNPSEVGADRIVNSVAAIEKYGTPVIVVDFGTATTFDAISKEGYYLGGAITPGVGISMDALFTKAAKLPRVELKKPENVIGKNTVQSMQSGIVYGYIGQIDGITGRINQELGGNAITVATGGLAEFIASYCETIDYVDPFLTLEGLRIIYQWNN